MARRWRLFSNHGLVLAYILRHPDATLRQMAFAIGLTERAVYQIVADLEQAGIVLKQRQGRRNVYVVDKERLLAHDLLPELALSDFLQDLLGAPLGGPAVEDGGMPRDGRDEGDASP
ncbi:MAG: helix-turn-helix domain-containing protein [Dehalococcoidia bacterium]|nr:helix-turn-helix domain-containing protein [Dehalococcoidia bacterium]MDW8009292.1 helix-turn-helix domain-containing protein [Chloroflexota bacterium]